MHSMALEIGVIILLIIANGFFALCEMAVISSRKVVLQRLAREGNKGAQSALELKQSAKTFLTTIQIGMTLIIVFAGVIGGATLADDLTKQVEEIAHLKPYSDDIAICIVALLTAYVTLLVGGILPKRAALNSPERVACFIGPGMLIFQRLTAPLTRLLSYSTDFAVAYFGIDDCGEKPLSEHDIHAIVDEGKRSGVFEQAEHDMLVGVFKLDQRKVSAVMTPVTELVWLNTDDSDEKVISLVSSHPHSRFPVMKGNVDNLVGLVNARDLLTCWANDRKIDLEKMCRRPLIVPDSRSALAVLEDFRKAKASAAVVMDEYGALRGLVTASDILKSIVGDVPLAEESGTWSCRQHGESTWIVDGMMPVSELKKLFGDSAVPDEKDSPYQTLGGFVVHLFDQIPTKGESIAWQGYTYEVMEMDGYRVDKVKITAT